MSAFLTSFIRLLPHIACDHARSHRPAAPLQKPLP